MHKAPKNLRDGEWCPSTNDRPRLYQNFSRSIVFVPRIAPFRSDIVHISPNERLFPTEHKADHGRFNGTVLSAVNLVWFTEEDHASKSNYADWAGSIVELPVPEFGIHKYINDIVPGYYVKIDCSETKKYAVLYVYRLFKSADGEPEIIVLEIDENEKFVDGAPPRSIKKVRRSSRSAAATTRSASWLCQVAQEQHGPVLQRRPGGLRHGRRPSSTWPSSWSSCAASSTPKRSSRTTRR